MVGVDKSLARRPKVVRRKVIYLKPHFTATTPYSVSGLPVRTKPLARRTQVRGSLKQA
jgi:hypothetical protein